jgi:CheY-like chemotaxis protein
MLKNRLLFAFILLTTFTLRAFNDNPEIKAILSESTNEKEKITKLNTLAKSQIENKDLNAAESAALRALEMAQKSKSDTDKAGAFDNLGAIAAARFDYTNAMNYFVDALRIKDGAGDKVGSASTKNHIGKVFFLQRNEENALQNYNAALALLDAAPNFAVAAEIHENLGDFYLSKKIYGKAISEYDTALKIWAENVQDLKKAARTAAYLGKVVAEYGDNDGALTYFNASLNFHRNLEDANGVGEDYLNIAQIYNALEDKDLAAENAGNALSAFQQQNNEFGTARAFNLQGKIALKMGDRGDILRGIKVQPGVPDLYKNMADAFSEMGNFPKAYTLSQAYSVSKDSLFNQQKAASLLELTTKYESEYSVKEKTRQLAVLEKEKSTEMMIRWLLIGLVACAGAAIYFVVKSYRQKQQDNEKLLQMNGTIQAQNDEIARKNVEMNFANQELQDKNGKLDHLNAQLVYEISARENSQKSLFNKDNYLAQITERMRQPLNNIVGLAQSIMNEKPRRDQRDHILNLQYAANNLLVLINDVLDYSEIEASKISIETIDFNTEDAIQDVKKELKPSKEFTYEFSVDSRIPAELKGDPARFNQVLMYIVKNMKRDMPSGVFKINILRNEVIDNELTLKIDIQAQGDNINYKLIDMLFNKPTNRELLETLNSKDMEMVVARRLVELQNGSIHAVQTKEEVIVSMFLPFKIVEALSDTQNTEGSVPMYYNNFLEGKRILVVEDNKVNQMLVVNMLKKKGVFVRAANDGIEGLEALGKEDFDLILMDIQMPRMDGYHAVAEIRRMKDTTKSTLPIIALTASAYVTEKEKAQLFGMTDHIGKPFSPEEMVDKITRVLMSHKSNIEEPFVPQPVLS